MKARRYGPICEKSRSKIVDNKFPNTIVDTNCPQCYGTGFINGYYPPTEFYALISSMKSRERRELEQTGTTKEVVVEGRFLGTLPVVQGDVWISDGDDDRYYIHTVNEAALWKGVSIVNRTELRLAPFTDAIYDIPVNARV